MGELERTINEEVADLAMLQFTDKEIATIMQMSPDVVVNQYGADIDRGRLLAEAEVRKAVLQLAKQGSTPAQKQFMEMNARAKKANLRRS
jgi:hypothetical protein